MAVLRHLLWDPRVHEVPVDEVVQEGSDVGGADVLVVQVVRVLPHILLRWRADKNVSDGQGRNRNGKPKIKFYNQNKILTSVKRVAIPSSATGVYAPSVF